METTAYLMSSLRGLESVAAIGFSVSDAFQILEAIDRSGASLKAAEEATESEVRILSYDDLSDAQVISLALSPSVPFLATEMPVPLPAPQAAVRRVGSSTVSWHVPADAFSTQIIEARDVLIAGCISARPGEDVTPLFHRLASVDPEVALGLAAGTYERESLVDLPPLRCDSLGPLCLEPLLNHDDRLMREKAIGLMRRFKR